MFITINETRVTRHHHPDPVVYRTVPRAVVHSVVVDKWIMTRPALNDHTESVSVLAPPNPPCSAYLSLPPRTPGNRQSFHCPDSFAFSRTVPVSHCDQSALSKTLTFSSTPRFSVVLRVRADTADLALDRMFRISPFMETCV